MVAMNTLLTQHGAPTSHKIGTTRILIVARVENMVMVILVHKT